MSKIAAMFQKARRSVEYLKEKVVLDFTSEIAGLMNHQGVSRASLARKINVTPAYISQVMRGEANLTVKTMVELAHALEARVEVTVVPLDQKPALQGEWRTAGVLAPQRSLVVGFDIAANEGSWQQAA